MKCFRCEGLDFKVKLHSFFGDAVLECDSCTQNFSIKSKVELTPIEILGNPEAITEECVIIKCQYCPTKRYIGIDCISLNMMSCGLCNVETKLFGEKLSWDEFLKIDKQAE